MPKKQKQSAKQDKKQSPWALPIVALIILAFAVVSFVFMRSPTLAPRPLDAVSNSNGTSASPANPGTSTNSTELLSMEVAKAVMVTAELEFPDGIPTIAAALAQIERRYQPDDGLGSSEKPGFGSLVFKRTGEVLWNSRIVQTSKAVAAKNLNIFLTDEAGATWVIDGSGGPKSILDARVRDKGIPVRNFWPDGAQREVTFVYSACGCPVKVMVRRTGERTARTSDQPVIFPDDPAAVQTIAQLMSW